MRGRTATILMFWNCLSENVMMMMVVVVMMMWIMMTMLLNVLIIAILMLGDIASDYLDECSCFISFCNADKI